MKMCDDEFETKENNICTKDKIEPQQVYYLYRCFVFSVIIIILYSNIHRVLCKW